MVTIAHNLITCFKVVKLDSTELKNSGIKTLVKECSHIKSFVEITVEGIRVIIPLLSNLAKLLIEALSKPKYVQLSFLFYHSRDFVCAKFRYLTLSPQETEQLRMSYKLIAFIKIQVYGTIKVRVIT